MGACFSKSKEQGRTQQKVDVEVPGATSKAPGTDVPLENGGPSVADSLPSTQPPANEREDPHSLPGAYVSQNSRLTDTPGPAAVVKDSLETNDFSRSDLANQKIGTVAPQTSQSSPSSRQQPSPFASTKSQTITQASPFGMATPPAKMHISDAEAKSASSEAAAPDVIPLAKLVKVDEQSLLQESPSLVSDSSGDLDKKQLYKGAPLYNLNPASERVRVHALKRLGVDLTSAETSLDFITNLVTKVTNMPSAAMQFIDGSKVYTKAGTELSSFPPSLISSDRGLSLTAWTLLPLNPEVLAVEDLHTDGRFKEHPHVCGPPFLRFFAAAPLLDASGQRVGCLSIFDFKPRKFDAESCNVLCNFAEMLMREVQRIAEAGIQRAVSINHTPENEQLMRSIDACSDGVVLLDVRVARWPVLFSNEGWTRVTGLSPVSGSLKCFWDMFQVPGMSGSVYDEAVEKGETFTLDMILAERSGKHLFPVTFKPATEALDAGMVSIKVPAQSDATHSARTSNSARLFYFGTISRSSTSDSASTVGSTANSPMQSSLVGSSASLKNASSLEDQPPIPGVKLGPLLGRGSFGSVHYGTWNGAQIAVKVIQHMATEAEKLAREEQLEAILGLKMLHPNIVRTFNFATKDRSATRTATSALLERMGAENTVSENGTPNAAGQRRMMETWIILELCNRGSLQAAIDKGAFRQKGPPNDGAPNMLNIMRTAIEIAGAMTYLHSLDILHSDLNGNNILLISNTGIDDRPFSVKVSDFGLSRIHIGERTVATQTYGTVTHMPPELLSEGRLSKSADVYAFGVMLWEMLTGQRPWAGLRHVQIITHKLRNGTQLKWPPGVYPAFKEVAQMCMSPDPHIRPTFQEVLEMLEPIRDKAERGELQHVENPNSEKDPLGAPIGAVLGFMKKIDEEGEEERLGSE